MRQGNRGLKNVMLKKKAGPQGPRSFAIRRFAKPDVNLASVCVLGWCAVAESAPAREHGRDDRLLGHDVFANCRVDVNNYEADDYPHADMVPRVDVLALAEKWDDPAGE